ncbi:MAG: sulfotransferase family protein [Nostocaceae cyanobacterium]|nr:sulfotransferase family protein [Nostocaceae cyanobacterium]
MNKLFKKIIYFKNKIKPNNLVNKPITIALHEYQSIYFSIPKVASSSWHRICATLLNIDTDSHNQDKRVKNLPSIDRKEIVNYNNYFKFSFVRNPWDRLVSCYLNKIKTDTSINPPGFNNGIEQGFIKFGVFQAGMSFEQFVRAVFKIPDREADAHFRSQYTFITDESLKNLVDFIGKLENADNDFFYILNKLGRTDIQIPHFKKSLGRKHYTDYYTPELITLVSKRYSEDIKRFGYHYDSGKK